MAAQRGLLHSEAPVEIRRGILSSGAPEDTFVPTGNPLSPFRTAGPSYNTPPFIGEPADLEPQAAPTLPAPEAKVERTASLPSAPPSRTKRPSIWDKEHISETLANIGAGFFQGHNFGDGLGNAAQTIAQGTRQLNADQKKAITYGGPDNQFEIATGGDGSRTVRQVPEFAAAVKAKEDAKGAPTVKDRADTRSRVAYAISQLPPEQRAAAYSNLLANGAQYGVDTAGMPATWSDEYGKVAGSMGMNVTQAVTQGRNELLANDRITTNAARVEQGAARVRQGDARVAQGAERVSQGARRLNAPPSARKGYSKPGSRAEYEALPSGSRIVAPDGSLRIKP